MTGDWIRGSQNLKENNARVLGMITDSDSARMPREIQTRRRTGSGALLVLIPYYRLGRNARYSEGWKSLKGIFVVIVVSVYLPMIPPVPNDRCQSHLRIPSHKDKERQTFECQRGGAWWRLSESDSESLQRSNASPTTVLESTRDCISVVSTPCN